MKRNIWIIVIIAGILLMGCVNRKTMDYEALMQKYPMPTPEETEGITQEVIYDPAPDLATETLFRYTLEINTNANNTIDDYCVYGERMAYLINSSGEYYIYSSLINNRYDELICKTTEAVYSITCDNERVIWATCNREHSDYKVYIYEAGGISKIEALSGLNTISYFRIDGTKLIGYEYMGGAYVYDLETGELNRLGNNENEYFLDGVESGYAIFATGASDFIQEIVCKDFRENVIYVKDFPPSGWPFVYSANNNYISWYDEAKGKVYLESRNGITYKIDYKATSLMTTGKWLFMCSNLDGTIKVFTDEYPDLMWEMEIKDRVGLFFRGAIGQVYVVNQTANNNRIITVYMMK